MKIYKKYILKKVLTSFSALVTIFISLIWFSRAIPFVKYVTENGIELGKFFQLFLFILPWLLIFIIPVSLFAGILITYYRMIMANEIAVLKNSGLTKLQISKPVIWIALACSFFCFLISFYIMPYANKELRISRINFQNNYTNLAFTPQTFENLRKLTIYTKNRDNNRLSGILLHDSRNKEYSTTVTAKNGEIRVENDSALLYMEDGTVQKFNYSNKKSEILHFDSYVFNLSENRTDSEKMRWKAKERYFHELINPNDGSSELEISKYRTELHQRITYPILSIIFSIIATGSILRGGFRRKGNPLNITIAVIINTVFLVLNIVFYSLIESSTKFIPMLYINFIIFFFIGYKMLNNNYRKSKNAGY